MGFVVVFGLLIALALTLYGLLNSGFGAGRHTNWLKLSGTLKKQGEPIYIADVKPADVPSAQNFFDTAVFDGLPKNTPSDPLLQRAVNPGKGLAAAELLAIATKEGGISLDPIANVMQRAGLVLAKTDFLVAGDRVLAGMRTLGLDFNPLAEAADRPTARFPVDYTQPIPPLPHLPYLEALGNWLAIHAMARLSTGDSEGASQDLLLIGRLADSVASEPFLPSQRTRRMLLGLFAGCARIGIDRGVWSDDQLVRFADAFAHADLLTAFGWAIRGERAQLNSAVDVALTGRKPASSTLQTWLGFDFAQLDLSVLRTRQAAVNQAIQQFLDIIAHSPMDPTRLGLAGNVTLPPATREQIQTLFEEARIFTQLQTYLIQAETACALERYRLARGEYPEKLADLTPDWLATVANTPISGKALDYRQKDAGYVLTSSGWTADQPWTWTRLR